MSPSISIRPSKDIRTNYAQISALTRKNPVAITVNGKEDTVLLSHEDFQDQQNYIAELEAKINEVEPSAEEAEKERKKLWKRSGLLLSNTDSLEAMDPSEKMEAE